MSEKHPLWYELPKEQWQERTNTGERTWTDSQKQKLYNAEDGLRFWLKCGGKPSYTNSADSKLRKFETLAEAQKYADKFLKSAWVTRRFGEQKPITVFMTTSDYCTTYRWYGRIRLNQWGMNEVVLLHELCHIVHPTGTGVSHGRYFARTFLEAVKHKFGAEAKKALRKEYIRTGVKCTSRPVYSEKTKAAMTARGLAIADRLGWRK